MATTPPQRGLLTHLLSLDAEPGPRLHLASAARAERLAAVRRFLQALEESEPSAEPVLRASFDAPDAFASASAYQWLLGAIAALTTAHRNNRGSQLAIALRAAWPLVAAGSIATTGRWQGEIRRIDPSTGSVVIPGVDLAVMDVPLAGTHRQLESPAGHTPYQLPQRGGLVLDPFDPRLTFRAQEIFEFPTLKESVAELGSWTAEIDREFELIQRVCPQMALRLLTRLVPVHADGVERAATHENVPEVTFVSFGRSTGGLGAALAHEEVHAVLNELEQCGVYELPDPPEHLEVGWHRDRRPVKAALHGIAAFGRMGQYWHAVARETDDVQARHQAVEQASWVATAIDRLDRIADLPGEVTTLLDHFADVTNEVLHAHPSRSDGGPGGVQGSGVDGPVGAACRDHGTNSPRVVARSAQGAEMQWLLVEDLFPVEPAYRLVHEQARFPWRRRTTSFYEHEVCTVPADDPGARGVAATAVNVMLPALCELLDTDVAVTELELHRLRTGDRIETHTDAQADGMAYRAVIGLDPYWDADYGGQLGLRSVGVACPSVQLLPAFAGAVILGIDPCSFHEVAPVRGPYPRVTLVVSLGGRTSENGAVR